MVKTFITPSDSFHTGQNKNIQLSPQFQTVFKSFSGQPKTMLMVSQETNILRANICRYVAELRKYNRIQIVKKGICPISKHPASFYTTKQISVSKGCKDASEIISNKFKIDAVEGLKNGK
jgi:hypothetical protein